MRLLLLVVFFCGSFSLQAHERVGQVYSAADTMVPLACRNFITLFASDTIREQTGFTYRWRKIQGPGEPAMTGKNSRSVSLSGLRAGTYLYERTTTRKTVVTKDSARVQCRMPVKYTCTVHSGALTLTGKSISGALLGGDTVAIEGVFAEVSLQQFDGQGCAIVLDARSAIQTSPVQFHQPEWFDLHFVKLLGLQSLDWYGTIKASYYINDFTLESCRFINPPGHFKTEPVLQFDNAAYRQMIFTGDKRQVFYNNKIKKCRMEGFRDTGPLTFGTPWTSNAEINRSIFLDGEMAEDTIRNITNTRAALNVVSGTGFGMRVHDCVLDSTEADAGAYRRNHAAVILWYGSIDFYGNRMSNNYAAALRAVALGWTGLPEYRESAVRMYNNIIHKQLSYSAFEVTRNGAGNRDSSHGFLPIPSYCVHNTIDSTVRSSYNGDYYGCILDIVNTGLDDISHSDSVICYNNVIADPEYDRAFDSSRRGYITAIISKLPTQLSRGNNMVIQRSRKQLFLAGAEYMPIPGSVLVDKAIRRFPFRQTDINGRGPTGRAFDIGAVEYSTVPSSTRKSPHNRYGK